MHQFTKERDSDKLEELVHEMLSQKSKLSRLLEFFQMNALPNFSGFEFAFYHNFQVSYLAEVAFATETFQTFKMTEAASDESVYAITLPARSGVGLNNLLISNRGCISISNLDSTMFMHEFYHYAADALMCTDTKWTEDLDMKPRTKNQEVISLIIGKSKEIVIFLQENPSEASVAAAISAFYHAYDQLIDPASQRHSILISFHVDKTMRILYFDSNSCSRDLVSFKAFYFSQFDGNVIFNKFDASFPASEFFPLSLDEQNECLKVPESNVMIFYSFTDRDNNLLRKLSYFILDLASSFPTAKLLDVEMWRFEDKPQVLVSMQRKSGEFLNFSFSVSTLYMLSKANEKKKFGFPVRIFDERLEEYDYLYLTYEDKCGCQVSDNWGIVNADLEDFLENYTFGMLKRIGGDFTVQELIKAADLDDLALNYGLFSFWDWKKLDLNPSKIAFLENMKFAEGTLGSAIGSQCQISTLFAFLKETGEFKLVIHPRNPFLVFVRHIGHPVSLLFRLGDQDCDWFNVVSSFLCFDEFFFFSYEPAGKSSFAFTMEENLSTLLVQWITEQFHPIRHYSKATQFSLKFDYHFAVEEYYLENLKDLVTNHGILHSARQTANLLDQLAKKHSSLLPSEVYRKLKITPLLEGKIVEFTMQKKSIYLITGNISEELQSPFAPCFLLREKRFYFVNEANEKIAVDFEGSSFVSLFALNDARPTASLSVLELADLIWKKKDVSFHLMNASKLQIYLLLKMNLLNALYEFEGKEFREILLSLPMQRRMLILNDFERIFHAKENAFAPDLNDSFDRITQMQETSSFCVEKVGSIGSKTSCYKTGEWHWLVTNEFASEYLAFNSTLKCFYTSAASSGNRIKLTDVKLTISALMQAGFLEELAFKCDDEWPLEFTIADLSCGLFEEHARKAEVFQFLNQQVFFKGHLFYLLCALYTKPLKSKKQIGPRLKKILQFPQLIQSEWKVEKIDAFPDCFVFEDAQQRYLIAEALTMPKQHNFMAEALPMPKQHYLVAEALTIPKLWILSGDAFVPFEFANAEGNCILEVVRGAFLASTPMQLPLKLQELHERIAETFIFPSLPLHIPLLLDELCALVVHNYRKSGSLLFHENYTLLHSEIHIQTKEILLAHLLKDKIATQPISFSSLVFILALLNGCRIKEGLCFETSLEELSFLNAHFGCLQIVKKPKNGNNSIAFHQISKMSLKQFITFLECQLFERYCKARFLALESTADLTDSLEEFILKNLYSVLPQLLTLKERQCDLFPVLYPKVRQMEFAPMHLFEVFVAFSHLEQDLEVEFSKENEMLVFNHSEFVAFHSNAPANIQLQPKYATKISHLLSIVRAPMFWREQFILSNFIQPHCSSLLTEASPVQRERILAQLQDYQLTSHTEAQSFCALIKDLSLEGMEVKSACTNAGILTVTFADEEKSKIDITKCFHNCPIKTLTKEIMLSKKPPVLILSQKKAKPAAEVDYSQMFAAHYSAEKKQKQEPLPFPLQVRQKPVQKRKL